MPINSFLYPAPSTPTFPYQVANSLRFDDDSSHSLTRTFGSGNQKTWTWSAWVKKTANLTTLGDFDFLLFNGYQDNNNRLSIFYSQTQADSSVDDCLKIFGTASGSTSVNASTSAVYRDNSAWYHVVCAFDTTQATGSDRIKIYVNGVQQTLTFDTTPAQNSNQSINFNQNHTIGNYNTNTTSTEFDGYMAEVVFIDGTALDPTSFGEFDSDSPTIWKPIDVSGLTFGTNGFYLDFEDSSALGNDVSGNNNDFTVNNLTSVDQSTDTCTNNFATLNPLFATQDSGTITEGNTIYTASANAWGGSGSTIGLTQGKWYFEIQINNNAGGHFFGVIDDSANVNDNPHQRTGSTFYYSGGQMYKDGSGSGSYSTFGASDIGGVYLNLDDNQISIYKNGSAIVTDFALSTTKNTLFVWVMGYNSGSDQLKVNFGGTPPFTISSGNADANGYGNFEYSPTLSGVNYYSINTKNLAEFG